MHDNAPKRLQPHGLRTPLLGAIVGLTVTLALLLALAFAALLKQQQTDQAGTALQVLARSGAQQLADDLFERSQLVQVLAQSPDLWREGLNSPATNALITRIQLIRPYSLWMGVADSKGLVVQSSGGLLQGRSVASTPWFTAGSRTTTVSDVLPAKLLAPLLPTSATGESPQLVNFSAPIHANGQLLGVLSMHTNWDWAGETLQSLRSTLAPDSEVELFIFDRNGRLLHAPEGHRSAAMVEALQPSQAQSVSLQRWTDSHSDFLTAMAVLPPRSAASDLGWHVVARQPAATMSAFLQPLLPAAMSAALLAALLASAALYWLTQRMLQELHQLTEAAQHAGSADPHIQLPLLRSSRELQQLSLALRNMAQQWQTGRAAMTPQNLGEPEQQSGTDSLTGLLNPRGLAPLLHFAMALARRSGRPLCLMSLDIDHLQQTGASSTEVRSAIIQDLARHLRARLRDADLVTRWNETAFIVLLPDTPAEDVQRMALDILATIEHHSWPQLGTLTLSAGMTALRPTLQDGTEDTEAALLQRCDEALQASQQAGGNRVHFQP
ncbi:MAG: sensor domain-containing diguanylate cyclase [Acidovorax sp.]|jgi:diguanylate cyclase (GGDEF)-like protein|nr:sensor domain-containing diguanylate cyclase [Acidovorax sp.]